MQSLRNLHVVGPPGGIFPDQYPCGRAGADSTGLASDRLPHEEALGAVTGPAERRWCPWGRECWIPCPERLTC